MDERLERLEVTVRRLRTYALVVTAMSVVLLLAAFCSTGADDGVLRVRGLIIEDAAGRERILIGAPIPQALNRVRTDLARVREIWGPRFPAAYMDYYKEYRHDTNGILILDEDGFDRVAIGDPVPDPNIGRRIGPSTGLIINDEEGFERSGFGLLNVNGVYRVVLGLDSARGTEGLVLMLEDGGSVGMHVRDDERRIFLGSQPGSATDDADGFHGLRLKRGDIVAHEVNVAASESDPSKP